MNKNSKVMLLSLNALALSLGAVTFLALGKGASLVTKGQEVEWGVDFSSEENAFVAGDKQVAKSKLGNSFEFSSEGLSGVEGKYASFAKGGKLANSTIMHQIKSLTVTFDEGASMSVEWGWSQDNLIRAGKLVSGEAFTFDGDLPDYFAITSLSQADVTSISTRFACVSTSEDASEDYASLITATGFYKTTWSGKQYRVRINGAKTADVYVAGAYVDTLYMVKGEDNFSYTSADGTIAITVPTEIANNKFLTVSGTIQGDSFSSSGRIFERTLDAYQITSKSYKFAAEKSGYAYELSYVPGQGVVALQGKNSAKSYAYVVKDEAVYSLTHMEDGWKYRSTDVVDDVDFSIYDLQTMLLLDTWACDSIEEDGIAFTATGNLTNTDNGFTRILCMSSNVTDTSWNYIQTKVVVDPSTLQIKSVTAYGKYSSSSYYSYTECGTYSFEEIDQLGVDPELVSSFPSEGDGEGGVEEEFGA